MKVFIHIGGAKTGTSTIQECLLQNKQILADHGYSYLHMEGRNEYRDIPAYCMNPGRYDHYFKINFVNNAEKRAAFDEQFLITFRNKINGLSDDAQTLIISSEHLSARLTAPEEVARLKELISEIASEVTICYYIRNQADKITSSYSTKIKTGGTLSFDDYVANSESRADIDYDKVLQLWEEVFGKESIRLRIFDRKEFIGGDLLHDFFNILDKNLIGLLNTQLPTQNTSLSNTGIALARVVNRILPKFNSKTGVSKLNRALIELISRYVGGKPVKLTPEQRQGVLESYEASNEQVRTRYFPERKQLFKIK